MTESSKANRRPGHVCPMECSGGLDTAVRRWLQNPGKILRPYLREGMTAVDVGCGPGFFTIPMARLVGPSGRVIAVDLQEGMLEKVRRKIAGTDAERIVTLHRCAQDTLGLAGPVDFVLLFYVVHELPDHPRFFRELAGILRPGGSALLVEPIIHVSRRAFNETLRDAVAAGFAAEPVPRLSISPMRLLRRPASAA